MAIPLDIVVIIHTPLKSLFIAFVNILLLQGYFDPTYVPFYYNAASWTLSIEFLFYLLCPFILFITYNYIKQKPTKIIFYIMSLVWLINMIIVYILRNSSISQWILVTFPFTRLIDFILGSLSAVAFMSTKTKFINRNSIIFTVMEFGSILVLPIVFAINPSYQNTLHYPPFHSLIICLILYVFSFERGLVSKILSNKSLVFLGTISFNIYAIRFRKQ